MSHLSEGNERSRQLLGRFWLRLVVEDVKATAGGRDRFWLGAWGEGAGVSTDVLTENWALIPGRSVMGVGRELCP